MKPVVQKFSPANSENSRSKRGSWYVQNLRAGYLQCGGQELWHCKMELGWRRMWGGEQGAFGRVEKARLLHEKSTDLKQQQHGLSKWCPVVKNLPARAGNHRIHPWFSKIPDIMGPLSLQTRAPETRVPESLCSSTGEACAPRLERKPRWPRGEKACVQQRRPNTARKKINKT